MVFLGEEHLGLLIWAKHQGQRKTDAEHPAKGDGNVNPEILVFIFTKINFLYFFLFILIFLFYFFINFIFF
jgi:hypothetical protein